MRIARTPDGFLFSAPGQDGWVTAAALGLRASTLADLGDTTALAERVAAAGPDRDDLDPAELLAPVGRPGKILAVGLNYLKHIAETGKPVPDEPMIFAKYPSAVTTPSGDVELDPDVTAELDYECELAVVIGVPARRVDAAGAGRHVLGYCVANDVSARDVQRRESQVSRSKGMDTFCPIGPWITTADELDPSDLRITTTVNGALRQDSTTADLLFDVPTLIAHLSRTTTLETGDVVLTGTPAGVGSGMTPPTYLQEGDTVRCEIEGLGAVENRVVLPGATR